MSRKKKILMIDNYDSFTYNLVQYLEELNTQVVVKRNDEIGVEEVENFKPDAIVVSPGPCTPKEAGISTELIRCYSDRFPILGVCLGHQSLGAAFGARIVHAPVLMHGKTSMIHHRGKDIFRGLPNPFEATRYHSLIVERDTLPRDFEVLAWDDEGVIMAMKLKKRPVYGVQFHPESILTRCGMKLLENFLSHC